MTTPASGSIELARAVDSIIIGHRHRRDLGDIEALAASIDRDGLLQPPTITPDGVLVCGARRIAAIRRLGWRTVNVWVRSGISTRLAQLLAEQDDNQLHKPLTPLEAAALYAELKQVMAEDAAARKAAVQFSATRQPGANGPATMAPPSPTPHGTARAQAAKAVTGRASYTTLEKIAHLQRLAADPDAEDRVRRTAQVELENIDAGAPVAPAYARVMATLHPADIPGPDLATGEEPTLGSQPEADAALDAEHARPAEAVTGDLHQAPTGKGARSVAGNHETRYPVRAFVLTWGDLDGWWNHYDPAELALALTEDQHEVFQRTAAGTVAFAERLRAARTGEAPRHLRIV